MARIRTTKPEFYTSEQVMNLSIPARFAFQGLWTFCDDGGNHPASSKTLKAEIFPSDDLTSVEVQTLVEEMVGQGLLALYEANGKQYWHVTGWHHQRIDKPSYKYPKFEEHSKNVTGGFDEDSTNDLRPFTPGVEGIGVEGIGVEGISPTALGESAPVGTDAAAPGGELILEKPKSEMQPTKKQGQGAEKLKAMERFERFWSTYPRKVGKDAARKAFEKRKPDDELLGLMVAAIRRQKQSPAWTKDGGQFIPHPSTWLNEGRWQDEEPEAPGRQGNGDWTDDAPRPPTTYGLPDLVAQGVAAQAAKDWIDGTRHGQRLTISEWDTLRSEAYAANITLAQAVAFVAGRGWKNFNAAGYAKSCDGGKTSIMVGVI